MDGEAEIIPGLLQLHFTQTPATPSPTIPAGSLYYWMDTDIIYEPFCADFGPCNLSQTWRFCERVRQITEQAEDIGKMAYLVVGPHPHKRANAAVLAGLYMVIYMDMTPERAFETIAHMEPFAEFRDAACGSATYTLGVQDVLKGMYRAKEVGFINWHKGESFDPDEYEYYEQVENGDMNWIIPGKFLAFAGPSEHSKYFGDWRTFTPDDYIEYFQEKNITSVVRLNKKMYNESRFVKQGINHHDLYFPDGTCPSPEILQRFLQIAESEPGALAVHCKAGLGRTGVLICCYMMKHFDFTAEEAMGYIRICRPGSVLGPQQHYLLHHAASLRQQGRMLCAMDSGVTDVVERENNGRRVINIVATSRTLDLMSQKVDGHYPLRQEGTLYIYDLWNNNNELYLGYLYGLNANNYNCISYCTLQSQRTSHPFQKLKVTPLQPKRKEKRDQSGFMWRQLQSAAIVSARQRRMDHHLRPCPPWLTRLHGMIPVRV